MFKNQNGITMISLVVTIIVMLILAAVVITSTTQLIESSRIRNYIATMSLVNIEVEKIFEDFEFENDVSDLSLGNVDNSKLLSYGASKYTLTMGNRIPFQEKMSSEEKELLLKNIENVEDPDNDGIIDVDVDNLWYKWSGQTLKKLKIDYDELLNDSQYFIINYATGEIIYPVGIEGESYKVKLYSLSAIREFN